MISTRVSNLLSHIQIGRHLLRRSRRTHHHHITTRQLICAAARELLTIIMALLNPYLATLAVVVAATAYIWNRLSSPLRRIPGPRISLFTSWVLKWHELHANRTRYIHRLHESYGPTVRVAPNEVSFASSEAVKEIYQSGGSGYDKTEFYDLFQVYGRRCVVAADTFDFGLAMNLG